MTINQLFKKKPEIDYILPILECFNIPDINVNVSFTKKDLHQFQTVKKLTDHIYLLEDMYLPCKAKIYLYNLNEKKSITILRQLLKLYKLSLKSSEKYFHGEKMIEYSFFNNNLELIEKNKCVISFE